MSAGVGAEDPRAAVSAIERRQLPAFDAVPHGIAITEVDDGTFIYANAAALEIIGYSEEDVRRGLRTVDLYERPERREEVVHQTDRPGPFEVSILRGDGERIWAQLTLRSVLFEGAPAIMATVVDVTRRLGRELDLRKSQERLGIVSAMARTLRAGLPTTRVAEVAVARTAEVLDPDLRVCCALLDEHGEARVLASEGPEGMPTLEGVVVDLSLAPAYFHTLSERRPFVTENAFDDQRLHDVQAALGPLGCSAFVDAPLFRGDRVVGVFCLAAATPRVWTQHEVGTLGDVAEYLSGAISDAQAHEERLRNQAVERELLHADRLKSIGQLAAGVAHEINNPAAFVTANLDALRTAVRRASRTHAAVTGRNGADFREMSRIIQESEVGLHRIASVASRLRAFARVERDEVESTDLNALVEGACSMVRNEVRARARLVMELATLPQVTADPGKISQVLVNLLVNAAHAIPEGAAEANQIEVRTARDGRWVTVSVRDSGSGMDEATRSRIFEPFYTTKPRELGTGLGLSLAAEIVRQHGGELEVDSDLGAGSTFTLRLPLRDSRPASATGLRAAPRAAPTRGLLILAIDDEELLLRSMQRTLGRRHEVVSALGGRRGLALLLDAPSRPWDAILCDLMMPDLDGQRVYEAVADRHPELAQRFVFVSGGAFTPRTKEFAASVGRPVLHKPVDGGVLAGVLAQLADAPRG